MYTNHDLDMLDEFAASKIDDSKSTQPLKSTAPASPESSGPGRPDVPNPALDAFPETDEDFAQQLQAGMAEMLKDLETNPAMAKQFEDLMAQFGAPPPPTSSTAAKATAPKDAPKSAAKSTPSPAAAASSSSAGKGQDDNFQETIKKTMERMRESSTTAAAASSTSGTGDDAMMAQLMAALSSAGGDGEEGEDSFSKMLLGMMEQLTNKDVLYDPMKELDTKFPGWLQANGAALPASERERYEEQQRVVREIVGKFETPGYSDAKAEDREYIVDRMQKVGHDLTYFRAASADLWLHRCKPQAHRLQTWLAT